MSFNDFCSVDVKYRHLITPVNRTSANAWLYKHTYVTCQARHGSCSLQNKTTFSCEVIHAKETWRQSGFRSCIVPRLPSHLVQESNVGTVVLTGFFLVQ